MWPAVKLGLTQEQFRPYAQKVEYRSWRPSKIVWHNTGAPSLAQWIKSADQDALEGRTPGLTRIRNLETYFRDQNHWTGAPHLFIANDLIWVFNPLNMKGVHSPSYNSTAIGIEMIGDFAREDDDSGEGLRVRRNTVFATAILCDHLGLEPEHCILLHKEDRLTTHDCPGKDVAQDKLAMVAEVKALMAGGEHDPKAVATIIAGGEAKPPALEYIVTTTVADLNLRRGPGVANESRGTLPIGTALGVLGSATGWLRVKTPAGYEGWVSERYTERRKA